MAIGVSEIKTAMEIAGLERKDKEFTIPEVVKQFVRGGGPLKGTLEYGRIHDVAKKMLERGALEKRASTGTSPVYAPTDLFSSYEHRAKASTGKGGARQGAGRPAKYRPPEPVSSRQEVPQPPKVMLMEDVILTLEKVCKEKGGAVSFQVLSGEFSSPMEAEKARPLLKYLCEIGKVVIMRDPVRANRNLYQPAWEVPKVAETGLTEMAKAKPVEINKVLGFQCEVCSGLVGVKAKDGLFTAPCSCGEDYLIQGSFAHRLRPGIRLRTWAPV
jgi:hypothetical protein